jgi:hypothetical protein
VLAAELIAWLAMQRRHVLGRAGIVGGALLAAAAPTAVAASDDDNTGLEGAWIGNVSSTGFPLFQALYTFARGGGMVTSSSIDLSPKSLSTPGYGAWQRTAERERAFAFTFDTFVFDPQGNPAGVVKSRATAVLDASGDTFTGVFKFDVFAPNGAIVFSGSGTHDGRRIRVEPV